MKSHQLVNQTSGDVEYFTPPAIIAAARLTMGGIDLDPASCKIANAHVQAPTYYTKEDDGLSRPWYGRVWLNHPFSKPERKCGPLCNKKTCKTRGYHLVEDKPGNADWINKLIHEYALRHITIACCITFASTSEAWFRPLFKYPKCWLYPRTNYVLSDGTVKKGITKGSVITYLGPNISQFQSSFKTLGAITIPL